MVWPFSVVNNNDVWFFSFKKIFISVNGWAIKNTVRLSKWASIYLRVEFNSNMKLSIFLLASLLEPNGKNNWMRTEWIFDELSPLRGRLFQMSYLSPNYGLIKVTNVMINCEITSIFLKMQFRINVRLAICTQPLVQVHISELR